MLVNVSNGKCACESFAGGARRDLERAPKRCDVCVQLVIEHWQPACRHTRTAPLAVIAELRVKRARSVWTHL
eukprot:6192258-Pleurochrysis_carterae.AAC.3